MRGVGNLAIVVAAVVLAVGLAAAQSKPAATSAKPAVTAAVKKNPVPATAASVKAGQQVYNANCRQCHGLKGKGDGTIAPTNPKPADFTDAKWDFGPTDGDMFTVIWNGAPKPKTEMKPMKDTLTEKDVWNVINFIRTLGPKPGTN
jgi:mono/diheme cytochrome c family protein